LNKYGNRAVTLIELMVVLGVVGLLAAIAIPRYADLLEKANLGATLGNLAALRSAYNIYYSTYMGRPRSIDPVQEPQFRTVLNGDMPYVKSKYPASHPPYGNMVTTSDVHGVVPTTEGAGWFYNSTDGLIFVNSVSLDLNGNPYSTY
jgi:prepilin-type N-terminal cleavage/methylation domain-containing protein